MLLLADSIFASLLLLCASISGISASKVVTLESIQIFVNHNFLPFKPNVYFRCQGEKIVVLPDVTEINVLYTFKGEESWQPLTELPDDKCKRCGIYQKGFFKGDDLFDQWELCLDDFSDGTYTHFKEYQLNATFRCPVNGTSGFNRSSHANKHNSAVLAITISVAVAILVAISIAGYKYWQKRKREQDQARFLKMFEEEGDELEDELGLGPL